MGKIVIFNGGPGTGKDTFGGILQSHYAAKRGTSQLFVHREMKSALNELVTTLYGVSLVDWWERVGDRSLKEEPWDKLDGKSTREVQIEMSEKVMKPYFGNDIFGKMLVRTLNTDRNYYLTDGGFKEEIEPIVAKFGAGNVLVVRLHREGFTFKGDSRSYIEDEWFPDVTMIDIKSAEVEETGKTVIERVEEWLKK